MAVKVAINGFGRIGRLAFRQMFGAEGYEVVAINDLTKPSMLAQLLKYDTAQGGYCGRIGENLHTVTADDEAGTITVDGKTLKIYAKANAAELPWGEIGVDVVGGYGTTAALALLNDAVKKGGIMASSHVGGLSGAFIPVSEDIGMIESAQKGVLTLEKLEAMTAICSVGLDMIAIPGDTSADVISAMIADEFSIDKDFCKIIHSTEVKQYLFPLPFCRYRQRTLIPHLINEVCVAHSGQLAFRTERHCNCVIETFSFEQLAVFPGVGKIEFVCPSAI